MIHHMTSENINTSKIKFKQKLHTQLFTQIDSSSLVVFRIGFGIIMLWEVTRYWKNGWIAPYFITPNYAFKYYGFDWVQAWGGDGMYYHFVLLGILAVCITIGFWYQLSTILFAIAFSYIFLLDQARYLNHFYLVILFSAILIVVPAQNNFSVDARLQTKFRKISVPAWSIWLLRIQLEIILIHAGLVKLNPDWLQLQPLSLWLAKRSDLPVLGPLFTQEWAIAIAAYGVIVLHLVGAPLLLWKKTRLFIFLIYFAFHILNHFVFSIGIFPWFTLFATLLFFDPDWPKQFRTWIRSFRNKQTVLSEYSAPPLQRSHTLPIPITRYAIYAMLSLWISTQICIPLRHWLYQGDVSWTEEGHLFAWQMKLRTKTGLVQYYVVDPSSGKSFTVNPENLLTKRQTRKMSTRPDMILQFAHYLRDHWAKKQGIENPEVYVNAIASLNGRKFARLIDRTRNLALVERSLLQADWILPLKVPLQNRL